MPPAEATTGFSGSTARGSSTNFQVSPSLIISGTWRNETLAALAWPARRCAGEDHGVLVEDQVLLEPGGRVGRDDVGIGAVEPVPDGLGGPAGERLLQGLDRLGPLVRAGGDLVDHLLGHAGPRQLLGRGHQRLEQAEVAAWTSAWTRTFEASSAESRFQPAILPSLIVATRVPPALSQRHSSRLRSPSRSFSR